MATANDDAVLFSELRMPYIGAWHAEFDSDGDALTGSVKLEIDGIEFLGTVVRSEENGARIKTSIVAGNGGLTKQLPARSYSASAGVLVRTLVEDILREAGEALSPTSDTALLARRLPRWHRQADDAGDALTNVADAVQAIWRVLRDGTIWIGTPTWPEATVEHVLLDKDMSSGYSLIAPERPDLEPGVTFRGQRLEQVIHRVNRKGELRTEAWVVSTKSTIAGFLRAARRLDYTAMWPCRVATRNADGTLQLVPDDEQMKGAGLDKVPMRGAPEFIAKSGDRVRLAFEGGDPSRPFAIAPNFEGERAVARVGDPVVVYIQPGKPVPFTGLINGLAASGTFVIANPVYGSIMSGQDRLRA